MFSKRRISETPPVPDVLPSPLSALAQPNRQKMTKPAPSIISADLCVTGNIVTTGDIHVEGTIEGDIHSHMLTVGQTATIRGEVMADDIVVNGRIIGRIRGQKVRLSSTAHVEGDIIHRTIAIEAGADFQGSVQRAEDPVGFGKSPTPGDILLEEVI